MGGKYTQTTARLSRFRYATEERLAHGCDVTGRVERGERVDRYPIQQRALKQRLVKKQSGNALQRTLMIAPG